MKVVSLVLAEYSDVAYPSRFSENAFAISNASVSGIHSFQVEPKKDVESGEKCKSDIRKIPSLLKFISFKMFLL